jgi:hypothetical protein
MQNIEDDEEFRMSRYWEMQLTLLPDNLLIKRVTTAQELPHLVLCTNSIS